MGETNTMERSVSQGSISGSAGSPNENILHWQQKRLMRMRSISYAYLDSVFGREVIVHPQVFYPGRDTELLAKTVLEKIQEGEAALETCSGTGAVSLFLAETARRIVATDINPAAVANINSNIARYKLEDKIVALQADVFPEKRRIEGSAVFDMIVANPPYSDKQARDVVEMSVWDKGNTVLRALLCDAPSYLARQGRLYVTWADFAQFSFLEITAQSYGYSFQVAGESVGPKATYRVYEMKLV